MDNTDQFTEFLADVETLRDGDTDIRTTAHTSSISADDWTNDTTSTTEETTDR